MCEVILLLLLLTQLNCKMSVLNSLSGYCWDRGYCQNIDVPSSIQLSQFDYQLRKQVSWRHNKVGLAVGHHPLCLNSLLSCIVHAIK